MITAEFDSNTNHIQVDSVYQWDVNQPLYIKGLSVGSAGVDVHFANKKSDVALKVASTVPIDGEVSVVIPNSILQEPYDIIAYIYHTVGITGNTIKTVKIPVITRPKPNDYEEPTGEEIIEIERMELEAKAILDGLTASEYSPSTSYKRPNIVYHNGASYMCLSNEPIVGTPPSNSSPYWQLIAERIAITSVGINSDGAIVFTMADGTDVVTQMNSIEAEVYDLNTGWISLNTIFRQSTFGVGANVPNSTSKYVYDWLSILPDGLYLFKLSFMSSTTPVEIVAMGMLSTNLKRKIVLPMGDFQITITDYADGDSCERDIRITNTGDYSNISNVKIDVRRM